MKFKSLYLIFLILFSFGCSYSQSNFNFRIGNGASFIKSGDDEQKGLAGSGLSSPIWSYSISIAYQKRLTNAINFNTEFQFARKGFSYSIHNYFNVDRINAKSTVKTLSIIIAPQYYFIEKVKNKNVSKFGIQCGIYGSFLFNNKWKYAANPISNNNNNVHNFDSGALIGAGYIFKNRKRQYQFDIRYHHGVIDISKGLEKTKLRSIELGYIVEFYTHS